MLDSLLAGFYNAIPLVDTVPVKINLTEEDLYEEKKVCDKKDVCHQEIEARNDFDINVRCWSDVSVEDCIMAVNGCGGKNIGVTRGFLVSTMTKDVLQCVQKNRNIEDLWGRQRIEVSNSFIQESINISGLQNSEEWQKALKNPRAGLEWLDGVEYTGEGVLVGVNESECADYRHPDFNEYDSLGVMHARKM